MPRIAGIKLHKTPSGKIKSATIDIKKHGDLLQPLLQQLGAVEKAEEDDFEKKWAEALRTGYTPEQAREKSLNFVRSLPWKK